MFSFKRFKNELPCPFLLAFAIVFQETVFAFLPLVRKPIHSSTFPPQRRTVVCSPKIEATDLEELFAQTPDFEKAQEPAIPTPPHPPPKKRTRSVAVQDHHEHAADGGNVPGDRNDTLDNDAPSDSPPIDAALQRSASPLFKPHCMPRKSHQSPRKKRRTAPRPEKNATHKDTATPTPNAPHGNIAPNDHGDTLTFDNDTPSSPIGAALQRPASPVFEPQADETPTLLSADEDTGSHADPSAHNLPHDSQSSDNEHEKSTPDLDGSSSPSVAAAATPCARAEPKKHSTPKAREARNFKLATNIIRKLLQAELGEQHIKRHDRSWWRKNKEAFRLSSCAKDSGVEVSLERLNGGWGGARNHSSEDVGWLEVVDDANAAVKYTRTAHELAHGGRDVTAHTIRKTLKKYFRNSTRLATKVVQSCAGCQKDKGFPTDPRIYKGTLAQIPFVVCRFLSVDLKLMPPTKCPRTGVTMRHVVVITDYCTGFTLCIPLPDKESPTVLAGIMEWIRIFGMPVWISIDNGTEFVKLEKYCELRGIRLRKNRAGVPTDNGHGEVSVRRWSRGIGRRCESLPSESLSELLGPPGPGGVVVANWVAEAPEVNLGLNATAMLNKHKQIPSGS